ncbi:hypothetical protein ACSBR1_006162 [Camellia fascicularis]
MKHKSLSALISSFNLFVFTFFLLSETTSCVDSLYEACVSKKCGGLNIGYPFWIQGEQEPHCGYPGFELTCQNNHPILQIPENNYTIQKIFYDSQSIRVSVSNLSSECLPPIRNFSLEVDKLKFASSDISYLHILSNCSSSLPGGLSDYNRISWGAKNEDVWGLALAMFGNDKNLSYALGRCKTQVLAPVELNGYDGIGDYMDVLRGFVLQWTASNCSKCEASGGRCGFDASIYHFLCFCKDRPHRVRCITRSKRNLEAEVAIGVSAAGIVIAIVLFCCIWRYSSGKSMIFWKKENEIHQNVEAILQNCGALAPKRYSYSCVKKMTNSFKEKLGQGGYGGVYKGKLKNGNPIAVKFLNESKGNGEEFINEVTSISGTSHINIVNLLGFCFEGHKRALIYEVMPNGSLEKFINDENTSTKQQLGWETLYQIAIGIARGLEYLHRGCNTRILHFDIRPHNILLDEDFCPKISHFGLAKLRPKKESIISMLGTRGTIGYIAPEVFSRNFGGVSHKSDVYSYGMMILEMVGGRKNVDGGVDHTSEKYFPNWIYKGLELEQEIGQHHIMNEEENERVRKMTIVGLWCIQTDPSRRPTISRVVDMLEGSLESLQIPTRPFLSYPPRAPVDPSTTDNLSSLLRESL